MVRTLLAVAALLVAPAAARAQIAALPGTSTCLFQPTYLPRYEAPPCTPAAVLTRVHALAVSPDNRNAYAAVGGTTGRHGGGVSTFLRDADSGALAFASCITDEGGDGWPGSEGLCADGDAMRDTDAVAVSPDGRNVYATAPYAHSVLWFDRGSDGTLTQRGCLDDLPSANRCVPTRRLGAPNGVAVSPDGRSVYVTDWERGAIVWFDRDPDSGALALADCLSASGSNGLCKSAGGLGGARRMAVAPDGSAVFVLADGGSQFAVDSTLTSFARDPDTGALTAVDCLSAGAQAGSPCAAPATLAGARGLALSGDGRHLYVAAWTWDGDRTAVDWFGVDGAHLRLEGCLVPATQPVAGCATSAHLLEARQIAASADGRLVVTAGGSRMTGFTRDPQTGALADAWCATDSRRVSATSPLFADCVAAPGTWHADAVTIAPDGRSVYSVQTYDTVVAMLRVAPAVAARAAVRGSARLRVSCPRVRREGCSGTVALAGAPARRFAVAAGRTRAVAVGVPVALRATLRRRSPLRAAVALLDRGAAPIRTHVWLEGP